MMKTDVQNYYVVSPGSIVHDDPKAKEEYLRQKRILAEKEEMKNQINNLTSELSEIKKLLKEVLTKG